GEYTKEELDVAPDYFENFNEANPKEIQLIGLRHINLKQESARIRERIKKSEGSQISSEEIKQNISDLADVDFVHLHNHSQFSVLQSTISINDLVAAAAEHHMPAVALTDHANMMGAFHFVKAVSNHNKTVKDKI